MKNPFKKARAVIHQRLREYEKLIDDQANISSVKQKLEDATKSIHLNPNDADAYYLRGNAYDYLGQYEKALRDYNKAIQLDPNNADAYNCRGMVYAFFRKYEKAKADYRKALTIDPDHNIAKKNLAMLE